MTGRRRAAGRPTATVNRARRRWAELARRRVTADTPIQVLNAAHDYLRAVAAGRPGRDADEMLRAAADDLITRGRRLEGVRDGNDEAA